MSKKTIWVPGKARFHIFGLVSASAWIIIPLLFAALGTPLLLLLWKGLQHYSISSVNMNNHSLYEKVKSTTYEPLPRHTVNRKQCEPLPFLDNGYYVGNCTANQSLIVGQTCTFKCYFWFGIEINSRRFSTLDFNCSDGGMWEVQLDSCGVLSIYMNAIGVCILIILLVFLTIRYGMFAPYTRSEHVRWIRRIYLCVQCCLSNKRHTVLLNGFIEDERVEDVQKYFNKNKPLLQEDFGFYIQNETPIHNAMRLCNFEIIQCLLNHPQIGTLLNEKNSIGQVPLEILLLNATRPDTTCPQQIRDILLSLIHKGCSTSQPDFLLNIAIANCPTSLCVVLLDRGANTKGLYEGKSALHIAVEQQSIDKVKLLVQHNAEIVEYNGSTPLEYAISLESDCDIISELLAYENPTTDRILCMIRKIRTFAERDTTILCEIIRLGIVSLVDNFLTWDDLVKTDQLGLTAFDISQRRTDVYRKIQEMFPGSEEYISNEMLKWYSLRKKWSHKVSATSVDRQMHSMPCDALFRDARRFFEYAPECKTELEEINNSVKMVLERVSNYFAATKEYEHYEFDILLAGSVSEDTKVFLPDEADVVLVIKNSKSIRMVYDYQRPFDVKIVKERRAMSCVQFKNGFMRAMEEALQASNSDIICKTGRLYAHRYNCEYHHKLPRFRLKWSGTVFKDLSISVDAVPAFDMQQLHGFDWSLVRTQVMRCSNVKLYAIPKSNHGLFPISFNNLETTTMRDLLTDIRKAYMFAKAVRLPDICWRGNLGDFEIIEPFRTDDFIKSYYLKCCLFSLLRDWTLVVPEGTEQNAYIRWTELIYLRLLESLERGKLYPYYYEDDEYTMFKCPHAQNVEYSASRKCCQTRKIMIAMCNNILSYLRNDNDYDVNIKRVPRKWFRCWIKPEGKRKAKQQLVPNPCQQSRGYKHLLQESAGFVFTDKDMQTDTTFDLGTNDVIALTDSGLAEAIAICNDDASITMTHDTNRQTFDHSSSDSLSQSDKRLDNQSHDRLNETVVEIHNIAYQD